MASKGLIFLAICALPSASLTLLGEHSGAVHLPHFDEFRTSYGRSYAPGSNEYAMRKALYERRVEEIKARNSRPVRMWTAGINHLSDRTQEEFDMLLGWRDDSDSQRLGKTGHLGHVLLEPAADIPLPDNVSWTHLTSLTESADQGSCGSCWAMATIATLNSHSEIHYGKPTQFSPQELVDCVQNPLACGGKGGCDGATVELGMDWVVYNGLASLAETPYEMKTGVCKKGLFRATAEEQGKLDEDGRLVEMAKPLITSLADRKHELSIGLVGYTTLPKNKLDPLLKAVTAGPVAISVAASEWSSYQSGIFNDCTERFQTINHAVVLIGYGGSDDAKYWLVQNSWSSSWGEDGGRIRLIRSDNDESQCYTDNNPLEGVSCKGAPKSVTVCGHCGILYDSVVPNFEKSPTHAMPKAVYINKKSGEELLEVKDAPIRKQRKA